MTEVIVLTISPKMFRFPIKSKYVAILSGVNLWIKIWNYCLKVVRTAGVIPRDERNKKATVFTHFLTQKFTKLSIGRRINGTLSSVETSCGGPIHGKKWAEEEEMMNCCICLHLFAPSFPLFLSLFMYFDSARRQHCAFGTRAAPSQCRIFWPLQCFLFL